MQLAFAFVADAAKFTPDGKLWVLGGDFDRLLAPSFPAVHSAMTLAVKLRVQPTECQRPHRLRVELLDPDGAKLIPELELTFQPQRDPTQPHRAVGFGLAFDLQKLQFPRPGDYGFHILVDDLEIGVVPLLLIKVEAPPAPAGNGAPPAG